MSSLGVGAPGARSARGVLLALVLVVVLTQRLALPLGGTAQLPLSLPLALVVLGWGLLEGTLTLDRRRTRFAALALSTIVVLSVVALARGLQPSLFSVVLLLALYLVLVVRPSRLAPDEVVWLLGRFVDVMVVVAVGCTLQSAVQYAGVGYTDLLGAVVPQPLLLQGYNTGDPLFFGSPIYRVNGVVFLEPSFVSYFLGLAAVVGLHLGRSVPTVGLLLLGLVPTLAGNGVVTLVVGVAVLLLGPRRAHLRTLLLPMLGAVAVAVATPVASRFVGRITEVDSEGTSLSLRLVEPYQQVLPAWLGDPAAILLGRGAGAASDVAAQGTAGLLAPALPKLLVEYGAVGAAVFLVFLLWSLCAGTGAAAAARDGVRPWVPALLLSYLVLNAALLQVTFALATVVFIHLLREWPEVDDNGNPPFISTSSGNVGPRLASPA